MMDYDWTLIDKKLSKESIPSRILLSKVRLIDESSRQTSAYTDAIYLPFYYYLGGLIQPKSIVQFGFRIGLSLYCFLKNCKTVEDILLFQKNQEYYSWRIGKHNLRDVYDKRIDSHYGKVMDDDFLIKLNKKKWDLIIIDEESSYDEHMIYLESSWNILNNDAILIMDYINFHKPAKKAFNDFCKGKNRNPHIFNTRYGTGLIQR